MKFLFVSLESLSGDLAWQVQKEGHEVRCYIKEESDKDVYDGFLEKVDNWEDFVDWSDVLVFDDVEFGPAAQDLRQKGKLVVGGSPYTDRLEMDREFGQNELKRFEINTLPSWHFGNFDQAIDFIKQNPNRYVIKPSGNVPSGGKRLLFVGQEEDGRDLLELFEKNKDVFTKKLPVFLLQKYVSGVEIAVGAFFNGKGFVYPINVNFEHKRLFPGDLGPFTGEMGTLMFWDRTNPIFLATLDRMKPALAEAGYTGYVDLNCVVNGQGIYPLEFTCRFGYPTIHIQLEGIHTPASEWLYNLAKGESFELRTKKGFQIGVRIKAPHYLSDDPETINAHRDLPVLFKKPDSLEGIHIEDVKKVDGTWRIAGESGVVLVVTGSGATVEEARRQAYSRVQNVMVQGMFYRNDIGVKWMEESDKLQTWGYI